MTVCRGLDKNLVAYLIKCNAHRLVLRPSFSSFRTIHPRNATDVAVRNLEEDSDSVYMTAGVSGREIKYFIQ